MGSARYVGRVGALAVALGIGAVIAGVPGVAWAGPEGESDPSDPPGVSAPDNPDGSAGVVSDTDVGGGDLRDPGNGGGVGDGGDVIGAGDSAGGIQVGSSGGPITSTSPGSAGAKSKPKDGDADPPKKRSTVKQRVLSLAPSTTKTTTQSTAKTLADAARKARSQAPALSIASPKDPDPQINQSTSPPLDVVPLTLAAPGVQKPVVARMTAVTKPLAQSPVLGLLPFVTLAPTADGKQPGTTDSPLLLGFLAAGRQVDKKASIDDESIARMAESPENSLMLMAAAVNSAPTGTASTSTPNQVTGQITGSVNGVDVDGDTLTYSVPASGAGASTKGTVSVNKDTGVFTYQPSTGARLAAQSTSAPDFDTFTVSVSDGQASTPVTVSVAVLPAVTTLAVTDTIALGSGANPSAVATYGNRTYVANATARTVKVVNTDTNQVIATVAVQTSPSAIAVSPDGKSVWVANSGSRTVQRIDTQSNTVVATVTVGTTPTALAVNGDSVWVANAGSNSVSRISMATNTVVATTTVGSAPSALAVSGDKVYVANKSGNSISVNSTATNQVVQTKSSVTGPTGLAVSGGKLYVTQQGVNLNRVLVLNASTLAQIATINMQAAPTSVAVTPDGAQAYVTMTNHRVSVINTATNAVVSTTVVNSASGTGGHAVAVDATATNGKVYITDAVNNSVRVLSLARGNTAPVTTANPSIDSTDLGLGTVTGSLNVKDWDGDTVTYTVTSQPTSGTITGTSIGTVTVTANGIYTFTPTKAAREQAAQSSAADTAAFTVRATDSLGATKDVPVSVTVAPTPVVPQVPVTITAIPVTSYPTAVAFRGNNAFVYGGDVIWTIDTRTNRITDWVALYNEPPVVSGNRRYEAGYMSVSVIDNQTNAVIDTIDIPNCDSCAYGYSAGLQELALSPDGKRLYARHAYALDYAVLSAVTVIDTSNNEVIGTTGPIFAKDIEIAVDGRVYAIDEDYYYADVDVYDKDMKYLNSIRLTSHAGSPWSAPTTFAISTDRKHAFAHVYDGESGGMTVSIIDTDPTSPTYQTETFLTERYSAVSPDGGRLYVPEPDGKTITVYDTATNAKVGSFVTDNQANTSFRGIYFAPNGTLYIADPGDNTLYAVTIGGTTSPL